MAETKAAQKERAELVALRWDSQQIRRYMKNWKANSKVRAVQDELLDYYRNSHYYNKRLGDNLELVPIREGLPALWKLEHYIFPEHVEQFKAILREEKGETTWQ